jgi:tetratricopeptide (TPR) repeat protein
MCLRNSGFPLDARRYAQQGIAEAEAAGVDPPPPEPYFTLAWDALSAGDNERAVELARTGAALAAFNGEDKTGLAIRFTGLQALMFVDLDAATAEWSELAEIAERLGVSTFLASAVFTRALIAFIAGDRAECERWLAQAEELEGGGVLQVQIAASVMRALLDLDERPADAMIHLRTGIEIAERYAVSPHQVANAYEATAAIWLDEGNIQRAAVLMAAAEALREAIGAGGDRLFADRREHIRTNLATAIPEPEHLALTNIGRAMSRDEVRRFALSEYEPTGELSA